MWRDMWVMVQSLIWVHATILIMTRKQRINKMKQINKYSIEWTHQQV